MQQRVTNHQLLSVLDAEAATGISRWTWRRWAYEGKIASVKLGKRLMLSQVELDRVIAEGTRPQALNYNDPETAAKAKRTFSKSGHHRQAIQITDAAWAKILAYVDANDKDLDKFLTTQMSKIADGLA